MADDREGSGGDISASELDELTHAELLMLYQGPLGAKAF